MTRNLLQANRLSLLALVSTICLSASAYSFKDANGIFYNVVSESDKTAEVTFETAGTYASYNTASVNIPATVTNDGTTYSVVRIGDNAFRECADVTSITLPASIQSLGNFCFYDCAALTTINIPSGITTIPKEAFYDCSKLNNLTLPSSVTTIGYAAFYNTASLLEVNIANSIKEVGDWAFAYSALPEITLADDATELGESAFFFCENLAKVNVPGGISTIKQGTFYSCTNLTEIDIAEGVTTIGSQAFVNTYQLDKLLIPSTVTTIANLAFSYCGVQDLEFVYATTPISVVGSSADEYHSGSFAHCAVSNLKIDRPISLAADSYGNRLLRDSKPTSLVYGDNSATFAFTTKEGSDASLTDIVDFSQLTSLTCGAKQTIVPAFTTATIVAVYVRNPEPPTAGGFTTKVYNNATLYFSDFDESVQEDIADAYYEANVWMKFRLWDFYSGINTVDADRVEPQPVDVYNLQGICIRHNVASTDATSGLPQGIYIVNGKKVLVR